VKFKSYELIRYAVSVFNQFFNNQGIQLRMKKYYLHQSRRISMKEFKILHVLQDVKDSVIKDSIYKLLETFPFYIHIISGRKDSNKEGHKMMFFTVKETQGCHVIKNIWSINL